MIKMETYKIYPRSADVIPLRGAFVGRGAYEVEMTHVGRIRTTTRTTRVRGIVAARQLARAFVKGN